MREKEMRVVITFKNPSAAMAMEKFCKEEGVSGRLIPVPREITSGCGLAWSASPDMKEDLLNLLEKCDIKYENIYVLKI